MAFRFRRSFKLFPGVRLNIGKRGISATTKMGPVSTTTGTSGTSNTIHIAKGLSHTTHSRRRAGSTRPRPATRPKLKGKHMSYEYNNSETTSSSTNSPEPKKVPTALLVVLGIIGACILLFFGSALVVGAAGAIFPSRTLTATATRTPIPSVTATVTSTITKTNTPLPTNTETQAATITDTLTLTSSITLTPTITLTQTITLIPSKTKAASWTPGATWTPGPTRTSAPIVKTATKSSGGSTGGFDPSKPTAICKDGTTSYSKHRSGTCSGHGGVRTWLQNPPG